MRLTSKFCFDCVWRYGLDTVVKNFLVPQVLDREDLSICSAIKVMASPYGLD